MSVVIDGTLGITSPAETVQGALTTTGLDVLGYAVAPSLTANAGLLRLESWTSNEVQIGAYPTSPYTIWIQTKQTNNSGSAFDLALNPLGGNVGIGTASPLSKLTVGANPPTAGAIAGVSSAINGISLALSDNVTNSLYVSHLAGGASFGTDGGGNLQFCTNGRTSVNMAITAAGLLQFNSGYGSAATAYGCRAWVNFNGTGTVAIRASGNVSSITDGGTGLYTANLATALPDTNGSAIATHKTAAGVNASTRGNNPEILSTTTVSLTTYDNGGLLGDAAFVYLAVFR